jgi:hypothetical protein
MNYVGTAFLAGSSRSFDMAYLLNEAVRVQEQASTAHAAGEGKEGASFELEAPQPGTDAAEHRSSTAVDGGTITQKDLSSDGNEGQHKRPLVDAPIHASTVDDQVEWHNQPLKDASIQTSISDRHDGHHAQPLGDMSLQVSVAGVDAGQHIPLHEDAPIEASTGAQPSEADRWTPRHAWDPSDTHDHEPAPRDARQALAAST